MDIFVGEQRAALYEGFQNTQINLLIRPCALAEKSGVFILFRNNIDFCLTFFLGISTPPAAERGKLHRTFAGKKQLPEILFANLLKHLAHIAGQMRLDTLVGQIDGAAGDDRIVFRHEAIPEAEHIVRNRINCFSGHLFPIGRFLFDKAEGDEIFYIGGANVGIFAHLAGDF